MKQSNAVRKGFSAAVLHISPEEIKETTLLPTIAHGDAPDKKTGIFDVRVLLKSGEQINVEMQVERFEYWEEPEGVCGDGEEK